MWMRHQSVTWLCGSGPLILSHHPAKIGVHRPYGTVNNGICNISSNSSSTSNSNSNAQVPMPRFTNGCYFLFPCFLSFSVLFHFFLLLLIKRILLSWDWLKCFCPHWFHENMFMLVNKKPYVSCANDVEMWVLKEKSSLL